MFTISINGMEHQLDEPGQLDCLIEAARPTNDLEIWTCKTGQASLCALLNSRVGWLMFLRFPGDAGFSSRNPASDAQEGDTEGFMLGNGQVDVYPRSWTFDRATVFAAISQYCRSGRTPTTVGWQDESIG